MKSELVETMKLISVITDEIIQIVKGDDYSDLLTALEKRQQTINFLESLGYSKEEYREAEIKYRIINQQQQLFKIMDIKKVELMEKLQELSKNKVVTKSYNHSNLSGSKIFSKKI
ncbi:hypothetical protein [Clostridium omnivorum]|uniref:Flagellar protein FliT n=1 Tax=Clostridium omnivorum TaxID=1604902 RepID=A0ABQ5NB63_9CLOT|nr:hypothetical protein [Clostridium sp. E14]GLC32331.1 hypothetical protein bsdE14_37410 [Clostridium sp. E14]